MKRNLLPKVAALVASVMTSMVVTPPERYGHKTPFGPCATTEFIDMDFGPRDLLPNDQGHYDLSNPCFGLG
jgi:hypothetical protein